jgi:hypothetical protein
MAGEEGGWARLRALVEEKSWDRRKAVFIIAGLDPDTIWPNDEALPFRFVWLPGGHRPEWWGLTFKQVENRVEDTIWTVQTILHGTPSSMAPHEWLDRAMRDKVEPAKYVHQPGPKTRELLEATSRRQGFVPPWMEAAWRRPELRALLPPNPYPERTAANMRLHTWERARERVRQLWDAWRLGEARHESKGAFITHAWRTVNTPEFPPRISEKRAAARRKNESEIVENLERATVEQWVRRWEAKEFMTYGQIVQERSRSDNGIVKVEGPLAYAHLSIVDPAKVGRPRKKLKR